MTARPSDRLRALSGLLPVVLIAGLVAGCSLLPPSFRDVLAPTEPPVTPVPGNPADPMLEAHEAAWRASGVESYDWQITYSCFCPVLSPLRISVADGRVTTVTPIVGSGQADLPDGYPLTVDDLYAYARQTVAGGGTVQATWDEATHVPASMTFDPIPLAMDDELYLTVDSFLPAATPDPGPS